MSLKPRPVDFSKTWQKLEATITDVITCLPVRKAVWNERFTDVYSLCIACPEPLANQLYTALDNFLIEHVSGIYEKIKDDEDLLAKYSKYWLEYQSGARYLDLLFGYLNHQHIKKHKQTDADIEYSCSYDIKDQLLEIGELALHIWQSALIDKLESQLVKLILTEINKDRNNQPVNKSVVKLITHSFVIVKDYNKKNSLQLYEECFEQKFLKCSAEFYRAKASKYREEEDCSGYMEKVLHLLIEEEMRSSSFLHSSSFPKVSKECRERMISDHMDLLHKESGSMIQQKKVKDLQHMYTLLKHIPNGFPPVAKELKIHIETTGLELIRNLKDENTSCKFVECICEIHNKFSAMIKECFQDESQFLAALRKSCETIVNHKEEGQPCKSPELVSKYCDSLLRKGGKNFSESELDEKLNNCITVFKYIEDKDLFQKFYSRNLAKRLIHGLYSSMDMEESMINRLKIACGYDFTSKLHRMYTDIRLSSDLNIKFNEFLADKDTHLNFNVNVLQAGAWPLNSTQTSFQIPQQLTSCVVSFEKFYSQKFSGRKLSWLHHLSQAEVRVQLSTKAYIVTMSTYQLAVLLLFNEAETLKMSYIQASTDLSEKELEKTINLLTDVKLLLNRKTEDQEYSVNTRYVNKRTKFKIAMVTQRDGVQEVQSTHTSVVEDRKLYLQAAIVRIMKSRKILSHNELIQEVISISRPRFSPGISAIKKSIESLIDKSYVERTSNSPDEYSYLA